jgi:hypothetical protein
MIYAKFVQIKSINTMTKNYAELFVVVGALNHFAQGGKTKGQKKLIKIAERLKPILDEYNEKAEELRLDNASVDKDGNLILNEKGGYQFTKEGAKKLAQQSKELNLSSFDYEPINILNPEGLEIYDFLSGWVDGVEFKLNIDDVEL